MSKASKKRDLSPYEERPEAPDKRPEAPDKRPSDGPYTDVMDKGTDVRRNRKDPIQRYVEKWVHGENVKCLHTPEELERARKNYGQHAANVRDTLKHYKNNDRCVWEVREENPDFARELEASHSDKISGEDFANEKVGELWTLALRRREAAKFVSCKGEQETSE
ncbi:MAG: hypothetical protein P8J32_00905 [bacterium]|nr:hypothetical protein [bacterium]